MRQITGILFALIPALAIAQGTAQRPGKVRPIESGSNNAATSADFGGWIEWRSPVTQNKTQYLPHCDDKINGATITVIDGEYNASTYHITVAVQNGTSNVDHTPTGRDMEADGAVMQLVCDGRDNWIVLYDNETGSPVRIATNSTLMNGGNQFCSGATCATPSSEVYCSAPNGGRAEGCSRKVYEDTLRGTDNGGLVVYEATQPVLIGLPRNTPHGAFHSGWETKIANYGTLPITIRSSGPSTITGAGATPAPSAANGGSILTIQPEDSVELYATQTVVGTDHGNYIAVAVPRTLTGDAR